MTRETDTPDRVSEIDVEPTMPGGEAALRRTRWVAELLDGAIPIPGTDQRIGIDPVISVVPIGGDALAAALSAYVVLEAILLGAPKRLVARMVLNIAIDFAGGAVPIVGVLFDVLWKANERNVALLERYVEEA